MEFTRDFGMGYRCTIRCSDTPPDDAISTRLKLTWDGRVPSDEKVLRPWCAWVNSIMQELSRKWGLRLFYNFAPYVNQVWVYDPGRPPKRLSEKEAKTAIATAQLDENQRVLLQHHDGSRTSFAQQVKAAQLAMKAGEALAPEIPMPNARTLKVERQEGLTKIVTNGIDAEILGTLPPDIGDRLDHIPDSDNLVNVKVPAQGRIQLWLRFQQIHPELGRWTYYEVSAPVEELQRNPAGKSAQAYMRMLSVMLAQADACIPGSAARVLAKIKIDGGYLPPE